MDHPFSVDLQRADRVDFDRLVQLEFRGAQIRSDGCLLVMRELDDALWLSDLAETALRDIRRSKKFPLPQAGSKNLASMRLTSSFNRSSIASTIHAGVKTLPWSATRCLDLIRLMTNTYQPTPLCPCKGQASASFQGLVAFA